MDIDLMITSFPKILGATAITLKLLSSTCLTKKYPGSEIKGVPASETKAKSCPSFKALSTFFNFFSEEYSWKEINSVLMLYCLSKWIEFLVSSESMASTELKILIALEEMSFILPIGVATKYNVPDIEKWNDFILF